MKTFLSLYFLILPSIVLAQEAPTSATTGQIPVISNEKVERETTCDLVVREQMPLINNLRIGMGYEEIKTAYPEIENNEHFQKTYVKTRSGLAMFAAKEISNPENKQFIRQVSLNIEDSKLNTVNIVYSLKVNWNSLDEMKESFSEKFGIDKDRWKILNDGQAAELFCKDFALYLNYRRTDPNMPSISMSFGSTQ